MSIVTEIETVDGDYCFCLRHAGRDLVLFAFRTEAEARIASDALRQIARHAVAIVPAAEGNPNQPAAEVKTLDEEDEAQSDAAAETASPRTVATSPFLGR